MITHLLKRTVKCRSLSLLADWRGAAALQQRQAQEGEDAAQEQPARADPVVPAEGVEEEALPVPPVLPAAQGGGALRPRRGDAHHQPDREPQPVGGRHGECSGAGMLMGYGFLEHLN